MSHAHDEKKRCILTVDDDRVLLAKLERGMRDAGYDVMQGSSGEQALQLIAERQPDLAILDISMPGMSGIELAHHLQRQTTIPFIFLSSYDDAHTARQAAANGAMGYLVKPASIAHLVPAIEAALVRAEELCRLRRTSVEQAVALETGRLVSELMRKQLEQLSDYHTGEIRKLTQRLDLAQRNAMMTTAHVRELARIASHDSLTELPNRNWLMSYLPQALERAGQRGAMLAVLYLDLDGFKLVNDSRGHPAGDELLRAAALRMRSALKPGDHIVRHGGDEFIIVIENVFHRSDAAHVAQRMADVLKNPFELCHGRSKVGASIGISLYPEDGVNPEQLLRCADLAMYQAKGSGKGRHRFYDTSLELVSRS
ncbi:MAG: diguanylate cyclase domain-containing protein [Janthinobacterium lividum]